MKYGDNVGPRIPQDILTTDGMKKVIMKENVNGFAINGGSFGEIEENSSRAVLQQKQTEFLGSFNVNGSTQLDCETRTRNLFSCTD